MPPSRGPQLTERDLNAVISAKRRRLAEANLSAGFLVDRVLYRNGSVHGRWSLARDSEQVIMVTQAGGVDVGCTCALFEDGENCPHVDALAVAWVRSPETFAAVDRSYTIDEFFDEHGSPDSVLGLEDLFEDDDDLDDAVHDASP